MSLEVDAHFLNLVKIAPASDKLQGLVYSLTVHIDLGSLPEHGGDSVIGPEPDSMRILERVKEEFKKDFAQSQEMKDIIRSVLHPPQPIYYLSDLVKPIVFKRGISNLAELVGNGCIVIMPFVVIGSGEAMLRESTGRVKKITFQTQTEVMISGTCKMLIGPGTQVGCAVLCVARSKGLDPQGCLILYNLQALDNLGHIIRL